VDPDEREGLIALTERRDATELALSDSLDLKGNIWLAVIAFVAVLDGDMLRKAAAVWEYAVLISAVFLAASGIATMVALWPREYEYPPEPRMVADRLEWGARQGANRAWEELRPTILHLALDRVENNRRINRLKSAWLVWAYRLLLPALTSTLAAMVAAAVKLLR
jgi:hypothetical protein